MKAFLSHSSADKQLVVRIHEGLTQADAWPDRAEIEWGDLFLEKITAAIEDATDFVLFWSRNASESEWVRLELNMAFIRLLRERAIRLRVVVLDRTPLPLYLQPYHLLDASAVQDPAQLILQRLRAFLEQPMEAQRHRFLNRNFELERIETAIDDPGTCLIVLMGVHGVGKRSLAEEAFRRFFASKDIIAIDVTAGTDLTQLTLKLNAHSRNASLEVGLSAIQLRSELRLSLETISRSGRLLLITNVQHWLDDDACPVEPLTEPIEIAQSTPGYSERPILATTTRRVAREPSRAKQITTLWIDGMPVEHIGTPVAGMVSHYPRK